MWKFDDLRAGKSQEITDKVKLQQKEVDKKRFAEIVSAYKNLIKPAEGTAIWAKSAEGTRIILKQMPSQSIGREIFMRSDALLVLALRGNPPSAQHIAHRGGQNGPKQPVKLPRPIHIFPGYQRTPPVTFLRSGSSRVWVQLILAGTPLLKVEKKGLKLLSSNTLEMPRLSLILKAPAQSLLYRFA